MWRPRRPIKRQLGRRFELRRIGLGRRRVRRRGRDPQSDLGGEQLPVLLVFQPERRRVGPGSQLRRDDQPAVGGWGNGNTFQIDWSIGVIFTNMPAGSVPANSTDTTSAQTTDMPFVNSGVATPDSDIPTAIPVTTANVGA